MSNLDPVEGKVKISSDTHGVDEAKSSLDSFGGSLKSIGEIAAGVGLERLTEELINLGREAVQFSFDYAVNLEQARIAYDAFTGSVKLGGKALAEVTEFARKTPFQLPEVVEAGQQLLGFGFGVDDLTTKLREVGSLASATHTPMAVAIDLFARAREGIFNLREYGQFGISREALEKFGVSFDNAGSALNKSQLLPALEKLINFRFGAVLQKESESMGGIISNIKDDMGRLASAFMGVNPDTGDVMKGSLFEQLKKSGADFYSWIEIHQGELRAAGEKIGQVIGAMLKAFVTVFDYLSAHKEVLKLVAALLAGVLTAGFVAVTAAAVGATFAMLAFLGVPALIVLAIGALVAAIVWCALNWESLKATVMGVGETIKEIAIDIANDVINMVNKVIDAINSMIGFAVSTANNLHLPGLHFNTPSIGHIGNIAGGSNTNTTPALSGKNGDILNQAINNAGGINITNNNTFNTKTDPAAFSKMLGLQVSAVIAR